MSRSRFTILKYAAWGSLVLLIIFMAAATVIEKTCGNETAPGLVYHSLLFMALWAVVAVAGVLLLMRMRSWRRPATLMIHLSFVLILSGALVTHFLGKSGSIHLREDGGSVSAYELEDGASVPLPFSVRLDSFSVDYYRGTAAPMDYVSRIVIADASSESKVSFSISMNNICRYRGYRFYQSAFDEDGRGTLLSVSHDPYGVAVTYSGYCLLLLSLVAFFFQKDSGFRRALMRLRRVRPALTEECPAGDKAQGRTPGNATGGGMAAVAVLVAISAFLPAETSASDSFSASPVSAVQASSPVPSVVLSSVAAEALPSAANPAEKASGSDDLPMPKALPRETAEKFGDLYVYYNDRIVPMQTLARDFTMKLYGKPSYRGLTAEQVLSGWMFYYDSWKTQPMIKIKDRSVRRLLEADGKYVSLMDYFTGNNIYRLDREWYSRFGDFSTKALSQADEKFGVISMVCAGSILRIFPYDGPDGMRWYSSVDRLPADIPDGQWIFMRKVLTLAAESVAMNSFEEVDTLFVRIRDYQVKTAVEFLPSDAAFRAEKVYNAVGRPTGVAMTCLTIGILLFVLACFMTTRTSRMSCASDVWRIDAGGRSLSSVLAGAAFVVSVIVFLYLTAVLGLRWFISGHVPMSNGFETMMFMAWLTMSLTAALWRRFALMQPFGFILTGFCLLVAALGESDPQITHLMPVLSSPLLSVHVACMMISYTLFGMVALNGVMALVVRRAAEGEILLQMRDTALVILYPALFFLTAGTFLGAVWANVSWGRYWAWDPKEVWALITMLVYSLAVHGGILRIFRRPVFFHAFCVLAFLCVVITYFGVNFILGGLHSYA